MTSKTKKSATREEAPPALVPKLRFPEFQDVEGWMQKEVGEVFQVTRGDVLAMTQVRDEKSDQMPYPVYSSQTKNNGLSGYFSDYLFEDAITWTTDGANAGDVNFRQGKFFCTNVCGVLLNSEGFANPCIAALINKVSAKYVSYVGNPKLMNGVMSQIVIPFPTIPEQRKIAECLSSVDELIAAEAKKLDALKTHKKGLMQQLFPREGETHPRLRFPEFQNAGEWEGKRLDELVVIQSGATPSKANPAFWNGSIPWVSAKDMKRLFLENAEDHISAAAVDNGARLVPPGTLLLLTRGMTLLKDVPICVLRREMSFNQDVKGLRPKDGVDGLFLAWMLTGNKERLLAMVNIAGHGTGKLDTEELKALELEVPPPAEQQRIADCLTSLDDLIAAQAQKLEALKTHKKGLMQQLFPSSEKVEA